MSVKLGLSHYGMNKSKGLSDQGAEKDTWA